MRRPGPRRGHLGRLAFVAGLLGLSAACSPFGYGEERFYETLGRISCEKAFECDTQDASETWFNQDNCETAYEPVALASMDAHAACEYNRRRAKKYVKTYKKLECVVSRSEAVELEAAWDEVYDCEGEVGGSTGDTSASDDTGYGTTPGF